LETGGTAEEGGSENWTSYSRLTIERGIKDNIQGVDAEYRDLSILNFPETEGVIAIVKVILGTLAVTVLWWARTVCQEF